MTDRELLEAAAKAAGIELFFRGTGETAYVDTRGLATSAGVRRWWNPLRNDGDALRLAIDLQIDVFVRAEWVEAVAPMGEPQKVRYGPEGRHIAARRAITRAAAELAS